MDKRSDERALKHIAGFEHAADRLEPPIGLLVGMIIAQRYAGQTILILCFENVIF